MTGYYKSDKIRTFEENRACFKGPGEKRKGNEKPDKKGLWPYENTTLVSQ